MEMRVLAIGCTPSERAQLERLAAFPDNAAVAMRLWFSATLDEITWARAGAPPDVILFGCDWPPAAARLLLLRAGHGGVPAAYIVASTARDGSENGAAENPAHIAIASTTSTSLVLALRALCSPLLHKPCAMPGTRLVLEAIADGVVSIDVHGKVCYINGAAVRLTATAAGVAAGMPIAELMVLREAGSGMPVDHPAIEVLITGRTIRLVAGTVLVRPDGAEILIQDATSPIDGADGAICGAVMVFHDVTDAHELQAKVDYRHGTISSRACPTGSRPSATLPTSRPRPQWAACRWP